jgi:hypothetical protein
MCGESRLRVSIAPIITMACHCKGCQKMSAGAFSLTAMVPAQGFELIKGKPQVGALRGESGYYFCPKCLNWLYTAPAGSPFVNIRPSLFDVPLWSTPFIESFVSEKLPWAQTGARHSFEKYPTPDRYGPLMAEYAARGASMIGSHA